MTKRVITGLRIFTVCLAKAGTGKNPLAKIVLAKAGGSMSPEEMQAALQQLQASLSEEQMAAVMALIEAAKGSAPAEKETPMAEEKEAACSPEMQKRLQKAHDDAAAVKAELATAKAELARRDEATKLAGFVAKASSEMGALPGIKAEELGVILKTAAEHLSDAQMGQLTGVLAAASSAIAKSALLVASGSDKDEATAGNQLDLEINLLRKAQPELSPEQALYQVARKQPGLFKAALAGRK
jgi:hypothetical protein